MDPHGPDGAIDVMIDERVDRDSTVFRDIFWEISPLQLGEHVVGAIR